jgi:hypothetical protein
VVATSSISQASIQIQPFDFQILAAITEDDPKFMVTLLSVFSLIVLYNLAVSSHLQDLEEEYHPSSSFSKEITSPSLSDDSAWWKRN